MGDDAVDSEVCAVIGRNWSAGVKITEDNWNRCDWLLFPGFARLFAI